MMSNLEVLVLSLPAVPVAELLPTLLTGLSFLVRPEPVIVQIFTLIRTSRTPPLLSQGRFYGLENSNLNFVLIKYVRSIYHPNSSS